MRRPAVAYALATAALVGAVGLRWLIDPWLGDSYPVVTLFGAVAAYGGLSLTAYAVCLAHVNDHLHPTQMVAASATVLLANGIGSAIGPVVVSAAMQLFGPAAFFGSVIVLHATFALYIAWRKHKAGAVPSAEKARFVSAPPQVAPTGRLAAPEAKPWET